MDKMKLMDAEVNEKPPLIDELKQEHPACGYRVSLNRQLGGNGLFAPKSAPSFSPFNLKNRNSMNDELNRIAKKSTFDYG